MADNEWNCESEDELESNIYNGKWDIYDENNIHDIPQNIKGSSLDGENCDSGENMPEIENEMSIENCNPEIEPDNVNSAMEVDRIRTNIQLFDWIFADDFMNEDVHYFQSPDVRKRLLINMYRFDLMYSQLTLLSDQDQLHILQELGMRQNALNITREFASNTNYFSENDIDTLENSIDSQ